MNRFKKMLQTILVLFVFSAFTLTGYAKVEVIKLVTEYHSNPIGIDVEKPRLSWQLISDAKNVMQTAYEIRVAESASNLSKGASSCGQPEK